jgi:cytidylate kinase
MDKTFQIAIDGPVGAGKSTVAKLVAEKLKILYVDTGAMYRAVALYMKRAGVAWDSEVGIEKKLHEVTIELARPDKSETDGRNVTVRLNGEDVSWEIRKSEMGEGASVVSQYQAVREKLVSLQRQMAKNKSVIMEGRDIGTKVLPNAKTKIYLEAQAQERAKRKVKQSVLSGIKMTQEEAAKDIMTRDAREMGRKIDPLRPAKGAWILDTTRLSIAKVVDRIVERVLRQ